MDHVLKDFIEFITVFVLFYVFRFLFSCEAHGFLASGPRTEPASSTLEGKVLNHCTAREVLPLFFILLLFHVPLRLSHCSKSLHNHCMYVCVYMCLRYFPGGASGKESACQCRRHKRHRFDPWAWQPTPVFLPGKSQGQRSLVGYCPKGQKESNMTEVT